MSQKKTILIIEDEIILTQALSALFSQSYEVVVCADGLDGYNKIMDLKPDIVLLDIFLPNLSGFDILKKSKENEETKDVPFVVLSNCGGEHDVQKGLDLGAEKYLIKADTELTDVFKTIEELLQ